MTEKNEYVKEEEHSCVCKVEILKLSQTSELGKEVYGIHLVEIV